MNYSIKQSLTLALLIFSQGTMRSESAISRFYQKNKKAINGAVAAVAAVGVTIGAAFLAKKAYDMTSDISDPSERAAAAVVLPLLYSLGVDKTTKLFLAMRDHGIADAKDIASFIYSDTGAALAAQWGITQEEFGARVLGAGVWNEAKRVGKKIKGGYMKVSNELSKPNFRLSDYL